MNLNSILCVTSGGTVGTFKLEGAWKNETHRRLKEGESMKANIHPEYGEAVVRCACGETFISGATKKELRVEICSKCHPFFTGKQKFVDTAGRVEKFRQKYGLTDE